MAQQSCDLGKKHGAFSHRKTVAAGFGGDHCGKVSLGNVSHIDSDEWNARGDRHRAVHQPLDERDRGSRVFIE